MYTIPHGRHTTRGPDSAKKSYRTTWSTWCAQPTFLPFPYHRRTCFLSGSLPSACFDGTPFCRADWLPYCSQHPSPKPLHDTALVNRRQVGLPRSPLQLSFLCLWQRLLDTYRGRTVSSPGFRLIYEPLCESCVVRREAYNSRALSPSLVVGQHVTSHRRRRCGERRS